jgi:hypothetical protein
MAKQPSPTLLGRFLRYFQSSIDYAKGAPVRRGTNPTLLQIVQGASRSGTSQDSSNLEYYLRLAATAPHFFAAAGVVADKVTESADFAVERQVGDRWEIVPNHEFLGVLEHPNEIMTGGLLLNSTAWDMQGIGNSYWFLVTDRPGVGPVREIWPLPALRVTPDPMTLRISPVTGRMVIDYRYNLGTMTMLPGENVLHIRTANLFDFWRGMSPLSALARTLEMDFNESNWLAGYFGEGNAVPTAIISVPPELGDEEFDAVKRDIAEQFGAQRRSAITRAGDLSVETVQHSVDDMRILDGMGYNAEAIRAVLRVPAGLRDTSSGESRIAAATALMQDAVLPMLWNCAEWMTLKIMPLYAADGERLRVTVLTEAPQDEAMAVTKYEKYGMDRTVNENRAEQKLEPLKLAGDLAQLQPLLDTVPTRLVELFLSYLMAKEQAASAAAAPEAATGNPLLDAMTGGKPAMPMNGKPASNGATPGPRLTATPTPEQQMQAMTFGVASGKGIAALPEVEKEAAQVWLATQSDEVSPHYAGAYRAVIEGDAIKALYRVRRDRERPDAWAVWDGGDKAWVRCAPVIGAQVVDREFVRRQGAEVRA